MKKYRTFLILSLCIVGFSRYASAGAERNVTADPTFFDGGNVWRPIAIKISTANVVLISSAAINAVSYDTPTANLGIFVWRLREIVNISTCCALTLYPTNNYNVYSNTFSVTLSSDNTGLGAGDSWATTTQDAIYGIWSPSITLGGDGQGAGGYEQYYITGSANNTGKKR
jgi:hypothetical protein